MVDFRLGMVVEDTLDGTKWVIFDGNTGQYGIGVYWKAYLITGFNPTNGKFKVDKEDTRGIDDHDTKSEKYAVFCMTKTVTQWFWDDDATSMYESKERERAFENARKKLTPEEFKILTGGR